MSPELRSIPLNCAKGFCMLGPLFESMITASFNTPSTVETELFALKPSDRSVNDFLTSDIRAAFQPMDHPNNHFVLILVNSIHGLPIHPLLPSYITPSLRYCSPRHRKQVNPYSLPPRPSPDATSESLLPYSQTSPPRFPSPVLSAPSTLHAGPDNISIDNLSDGALPVTDRRSANDRDLVPDGTSADVAAACHQLGFVLESVKYQRRQGRGVSFLNMLNNWTATSNFIVALGYDRNGGLESQKVTFKDGPQSFADLLVNELGWEIRGYQKKRTLFQWAEEATLRRKWSLTKSQNTEAFRTWMRMCYIWHDPGFVRTHSRLDSNADDEKEREAALLRQDHLSAHRHEINPVHIHALTLVYQQSSPPAVRIHAFTLVYQQSSPPAVRIHTFTLIYQQSSPPAVRIHAFTLVYQQSSPPAVRLHAFTLVYQQSSPPAVHIHGFTLIYQQSSRSYPHIYPHLPAIISSSSSYSHVYQQSSPPAVHTPVITFFSKDSLTSEVIYTHTTTISTTNTPYALPI
ncbi:hypothetical protein F5876DRAFT_83967 [Lentinula aff. lateritia]|uniref:Uncharacterized protein n=1 Tax=Lentinula aff. lateritia TaxID=2804960 RepID=A0ACC1TH48_9AGAR|nr:hypothetical protein F5876DRAFT_83967 [Lentinula aff. lateritia]